MDNAIFLKDRIELIIASTGAEKCEGGRYAAFILEKLDFNVIQSRNDYLEYTDDPSEIDVPISRSDLPLVEKVEKIMSTVLDDFAGKLNAVEPTCGLWGVPPHDFEILRMFPDATHVYGWTRCVEAGRPADINLECFVDPGVPTVFYTQSFCAKSQLAKYLAEKHGGLFIDADGPIGTGVRARIEAFLKLSVAK